MKIFIFLILFSFVCTVEAEIHPEIQYLFPIPNTDYHAKETELIIRFNMIIPNQLNNLNSFIKINGEKSGEVTGKTTVSSDNRTIIFKPSMPFVPGEKVHVHLTPQIREDENNLLDINYYYSISPTTEKLQVQSENNRIVNGLSESDNPSTPEIVNSYPIVRNGISFPTDFPWLDIFINDGDKINSLE